MHFIDEDVSPRLPCGNTVTVGGASGARRHQNPAVPTARARARRRQRRLLTTEQSAAGAVKRSRSRCAHVW